MNYKEIKVRWQLWKTPVGSAGIMKYVLIITVRTWQGKSVNISPGCNVKEQRSVTNKGSAIQETDEKIFLNAILRIF